MITGAVMGAFAGLMVTIVLTLMKGKLQLTKNRVVYDTPARVIALVSLLPLLGLVAYLVTTKTTVNNPSGLGIFLLTIASCVALMYGIGWGLGETPRQTR